MKEKYEIMISQALLIIFGLIVVGWAMTCPYIVLSIVLYWIGASFGMAGVASIIANSLKKREKKYVVVGWKENEDWNPDEKVEFKRLIEPCALEHCISEMMECAKVADDEGVELTIISYERWVDLCKK